MTRSEISKRYYEKHKAECLRRTREWKRATRAYSTEKAKAAKRAWYARNKETIAAKVKTKIRIPWSDLPEEKRNKQREASRNRMRYLPKEKKRKAAKRYRDKNRERLQQRQRDRYSRDPKRREACKRASATRKARVRGSSISRYIDRMEIFDRDKGVCHLCGLLADKKSFHMDHIRPLSKGGSHTHDNVAVSHAKCNQRKGNRYETC